MLYALENFAMTSPSVNGARASAPLFAEALDMAGEDSVHIAGGGEIYQAALPMATHLDLTEIDAAPDGDTYFPEFDLSEWREVASEPHPADERHAHAFTFRMYERAAASIAD